jgi:hypothetical protein
VLIGSCLGGVLSLTNLYIGLKAGWGFGVAITASILSYAIWTSLLKVGLARTPMTILENNCMQSTASSAGYSTGGTLISAFAAYIIINHRSMSVSLMLAWVFFIAVLGVTMAIPMKRQAQPTFIEVWDRRTPRVPFQQTSILAVVHRLARRCGVCLLRCWAPLQTSFAFPSILDFGMPSRRALLPSTASPAIALAVWSRCLPSSAHGQRSHAIDGTRSVLDGIGSGALVGVR